MSNFGSLLDRVDDVNARAQSCLTKIAFAATLALNLSLYYKPLRVVSSKFPPNHKCLLRVESYISAGNRNVVLVEEVGSLVLVQFKSPLTLGNKGRTGSTQDLMGNPLLNFVYHNYNC